jgi:hypothetical protein
MMGYALSFAQPIVALAWAICGSFRELVTESGSISNSSSESNTPYPVKIHLCLAHLLVCTPQCFAQFFSKRNPHFLVTESVSPSNSPRGRPTRYQSKRYSVERLEHQAARRRRFSCCSNRRISRPARSNDVTGNFLFHVVNSFWYESVLVGYPRGV